MTRQRFLFWVAANALGLGVGFVAALQAIALLEFGFDTEKHWEFGRPVGQEGRAYLARLVGNLLHGALLGSAQALVLRFFSVRITPWILATTAGFGLFVAVEWPLMAAGVWGSIPGPVEPVLILLVGCSLAGFFQYQALRRQDVHAPRWIVLWIVGLFASLVPTALVFLSLEELGVFLSWPMETFISGCIVAGVAAAISGLPDGVRLCNITFQQDGPTL